MIEQITETVVVANLMKDNNSVPIDELISKIYELKAESLDLIEKSNNFRP